MGDGRFCFPAVLMVAGSCLIGIMMAVEAAALAV
jgi:hypothetical protein